MLGLLRCLAEAAFEKGIRGLAAMVPGGAYLHDLFATAGKKYLDRRKDAEIRAEIERLAQASFEEARKAAVEAVKAAVPPSTPAEDRITLELYLSQVPGTVRRSMRRPEDPAGKTVSPGFRLGSADDLARLLPDRAPRFRPGDPVPGPAWWSLVRLLGVGGFGEVWLARHADGSEGAVKFCHEDHAADLRHEERVIRRVMAAGPNPHVVPLLEANFDCGTPWLLYEYVPGDDLGKWILKVRSRPVGERVRQAVLALRQLAAAVEHFHRLTPPVVHRDLKPDNIFVDRTTARLRVTDFGIGAVAARATLAEEARRTTAADGGLTGFWREAHTPVYASPQQQRNVPPDPRDDVYSLGVIAYQLLTGQLTVAPGTDFGHDLRDLGVDPALTDLIGECVSNNPARRPADAGELLRRVRAIPTPGRGGDAGWGDESPPCPGEEIAPARPRKRQGPALAWVCAIGGAALVLAVATIAVVRKAERARPEAPPSEPRRPEPPVRRDPAAPGPAVPPPRPAAEPGAEPAPEPDRPTQAAAYFRRGEEFYSGRGVARDFAKAREWWEKAAALGHTGAQLNLGTIYANGQGVEQDYVKAREWWEKAAERGDARAQFNLGVLYHHGRGVVRDYARAKEWYEKAARADDAKAQFNLGCLYRDGLGVGQDYAEARAWFDKAASQGDAKAQYSLGALYETGRGVPRDAELALGWYRKAVAQGDAEAVKAVERLEKAAEDLAAAKAAEVREAIRALAKELKAKEPATRVRALERIAAYGPEANVVGEQLIEAMADKVPAVRAAASEALEKVNPKVHPHVLTLLVGMNKGDAVRQLEKCGADAAVAVPLLLSALGNSYLVRDTATNQEVNLFAAVSKIAPKDKRFAAVVLASVSAPIPPAEAGNFPMGGPRSETRLAALAHLNEVEADTADKVKALSAALGDGVGTLRVIAALEGFGKDAAPALPLLKKLRASPDDAVRNAAIKAVARIEP